MNRTLVLIGILTWSWSFSDIEFRLTFFFTVEWLLIANCSSHDLLGQILAIIVLTWARSNHFLCTELVVLLIDRVFSTFRACKSIASRLEPNFSPGSLRNDSSCYPTWVECRPYSYIVMTRTQLLGHLLVSRLLSEPLNCRAEELETVRLGLGSEITLLSVEVLARARCDLIVITLKDVLDALLFVR